MSHAGFLVDLSRAGYRVAHFVRRAYWRLRRPTTVGVRVLVRTQHAEVVLIEHTYERGVLYLPGGRLGRETSADGALRELYEETGIESKRGVQGLRLLAVLTNFSRGNTDHVIVYDLPPEEWKGVPAVLPNRKSEILAVTKAPINDLPSQVSTCTFEGVCAYARLERVSRGLAE